MIGDRLLDRLNKLEWQIGELQNPDSVSLFRMVKQQNQAATDRRYRQKAQKVTKEWEFSETDCDCPTTEERMHKLIRFKSADGRFYVCCPIRFFMLHCWKAITEKASYPTRDWLGELLGK